MRHPILTLAAYLFYIVAALEALGLYFFARAFTSRTPEFTMIMLGGSVGVAVTIAAGGVLKLLIEIEASTRRAREMAAPGADGAEPASEAVPIFVLAGAVLLIGSVFVAMLR